jgi:zinc transport system permease protein
MTTITTMTMTTTTQTTSTGTKIMGTTGMLDDFLVRAGLAGIGVAVAAGPLGCFVVWRRMAYFGDATAHAALLGVALALGFGISVVAGTLGVALAMGVAVASLSHRTRAMDTALGVVAHAALALGLVAIGLVQGVRVDLQAFLFGDILAVDRTDLAVIWSGAMLTVALLVWRWQPLLTETLNPDLAQASGYDPRREQLVLIVALAVVVAVAIKVVGALLISAMLLIPAASARPLARTPEAMALIAVAIAVLSVLAGLWASLRLDTQTGPSIVAASAVFFAASLLIRR